jgi:hypothetical protein
VERTHPSTPTASAASVEERDLFARHLHIALDRIADLERRVSLLEGKAPGTARPLPMRSAVQRDRERAEMGLRELPGARARRLAALQAEQIERYA